MRVNEKSGFDSQHGKEILRFVTVSRPSMEHAKSPNQWIPVAISPEGKAVRAWSWPFISILCWGQYIHPYLRFGGTRIRLRVRSLDFFNLPNPSIRTMALESTQPLTEMSTRNLPGSKERPVRMADNLTTICEPTVYKTWEPRRLTILRAYMACYRDSFIFFIYLRLPTSLHGVVFSCVGGGGATLPFYWNSVF
jgi:hypothetical protein